MIVPQDVRVTTLDNGLRVVTHHMPTVESVSLGVWIDVGTRHEPAAINGISHLLEHMAFKGTENRSARAIAEEIEAVGGHLNAYTSREHTAFHAKVLKEDTGLALDLIADIVQNPVFDAEELRREKQVVLAEIGQSVDTPDDIIFDHFQTTAFPAQAIGRPVLGTPDVVQALTPDDLRGYMDGYYTPRNMVLAAAGKLDHDRFVDMAATAFAHLPAGAQARPEPARYSGGDFRESRTLEQVHVILGFDGVDYEGEDFYTSAVLSAALGGGMSSRLFQEIREERGLVYTIFSFSSSYADGGLFAVYAGTGPGDVKELIPVVCDEILGAADGFSPEEIARGKAQIKAGLLMSLESTSSRCEQIARQMLVYGRPVPMDELVAKIEAVDGAALGELAGRLFVTPPTFATMGPLDAVPDYDSVKARLVA